MFRTENKKENVSINRTQTTEKYFKALYAFLNHPAPTSEPLKENNKRLFGRTNRNHRKLNKLIHEINKVMK